jgi:hypothetical protein
MLHREAAGLRSVITVLPQHTGSEDYRKLYLEHNGGTVLDVLQNGVASLLPTLKPRTSGDFA